MRVKLKKLTADAVIPSYSKKGDAGLDLTALSKDVVNEKEFGYIEYDTGIAIEIPEGYVGLVFPRSSISNTGSLLSNSVGVIDSSYRGSIKLRFKHIKDSKEYEIGDRVGQLIIMPYPTIELDEVEELSLTERGEGGYGSSGK